MNTLLQERHEIIYKGLSLLLSSIFFANVPILLFLVYMGHHGFFSYDFFTEGVFGLKTFFFLTSVFLIMASLAFTGSSYFFVNKIMHQKFRRKDYQINKKAMWGLIIFNLGCISLIAIPLLYDFSQRRLELFGFLVMMGAIIISHITFLFNAKSKNQFYSLAFVCFAIVVLMTAYPKQAATLLSLQLKNFGIGGEISVKIESIREKDTLSGKLLLTTPQHFYIILSGEKGVSTIDRNKYGVITVM